MASKYWWVQTGHQTLGKTSTTSWMETVYVMTTKPISKRWLNKIMTRSSKDRYNEVTNVTVREAHEQSEGLFKIDAARRPDAVKVYDKGKLVVSHYIDGGYYHVISGTPKPGDVVMINGTNAIRTLKLGNYEKCFPRVYFGDPKNCKKVVRFNRQSY